METSQQFTEIASQSHLGLEDHTYSQHFEPCSVTVTKWFYPTISFGQKYGKWPILEAKLTLSNYCQDTRSPVYKDSTYNFSTLHWCKGDRHSVETRLQILNFEPFLA